MAVSMVAWKEAKKADRLVMMKVVHLAVKLELMQVDKLVSWKESLIE